MTFEDLTGALIVVAFSVGFVLLLGRLFRRKPTVRPQVDRDAPPANAILVDGSNVMHWGGDPSQLVLVRVIDALCQKGFAPVVVFDASVGYRLGNRYMHGPEMAQMVGLPRAQVYVVQKGVIADQVILDLAQTHGLRVVTNDQFRDWRTAFPILDKKDVLVKGVWQEGNVMWRGKGF